MEARGVIGKEAFDTESAAVAFHSEPWQLRTHSVGPRTPKKHDHLRATKAGMTASLGAPGLLGSGPPVSEPTPPWPSWFSFQSGPSRRDGTREETSLHALTKCSIQNTPSGLSEEGVPRPGPDASLGDVPVGPKDRASHVTGRALILHRPQLPRYQRGGRLPRTRSFRVDLCCNESC